MKISAVFSDYDGTLAPGDIPIESSRVPDGVAEALRAVGSLVPVAIVTSKDYSFIRPRTPFARAWACVSGLEIVLSDGRTIPPPPLSGRLRGGLEYAKRRAEPGVSFELKRSTSNRLLGFSVDWRRGAPPRHLEEEIADLTGMGLSVVHDPSWPFLDVFGAKPDKGRAVGELRRLLGLSDNIVFLGDSASDNKAFEEVEISIGVDHGQRLDEIRCGFVLRYDDLGPLLRSLAESDLSLDLRSLQRAPRR